MMKKKNKVYVYAICKDEEKFAKRWMTSMKEADGIFVLDTGSSDGTVQTLRDLGAVVHEEIILPWRFDVARNRSLAHVPQDGAICVCTDLDEVFESGWRRKLERAWNQMPGCRQMKYTYNWSLNLDGSPAVTFIYNKIHGRDDFAWEFPCHEWLRYKDGEEPVIAFEPGIVLNHYPDQEKSRSSYLTLLEMAVNEKPLDARMTYYLGREYMFANNFARCQETLKKYLELPTATWHEERGAAMRWIAECCFREEDYEAARKWYLQAIIEAGHMREPYVEYANNLYNANQQDWPTIYWLTEQALRISNKSETFINECDSWNFKPYDLAAMACYYLGMYEQAYQHGKKALELLPGNDQLLANMNFYKQALKEDR